MTITKSKIAMAEGILDGKKAIFQINFQRQVAHSLDLFTSVAPLEGADCRKIAAVVDALFPLVSKCGGKQILAAQDTKPSKPEELSANDGGAEQNAQGR